jgi:hypothetical protein
MGFQIQANFREEIVQLAPFLKKPGVPAAESLLDAVQAGRVYQHSRKARYLTDLLGDTRHMAGSETLRVFQNLILGNVGFEQAYGFPAEFTCESYLKRFDSSLLTPETQIRLKSLMVEGGMRAAVITARPSLAPAGTTDAGNDYSPEAEMAMDLTGIGRIPVVGFGTIQFLSEKIGVLPDSMIKPSPVQALAAIAAACGGEMAAALDWAAAKVFENGQSPAGQTIPTRFTLHIFEDSAIGIQACQRATAILQRNGIDAAIKAWGIACNPDKIKALEAVGARIFPDVNQAIAEALFKA